MKRVFSCGGLCLFAVLALVSARAAVGASKACPSPAPAYKIPVNKDGWYRIANATTPFSGCDLTLLHLTASGQEIAFELSGSTIEFYGQALDTTTTGTQIYWLTLGATTGSRISTANAAGNATQAPTGTFQTTLEVRDRESYYAALPNGNANSFFGSNNIGYNLAPDVKTINVPHVDTTQGATLRVDLNGYVNTRCPPDITQNHSVNFALNASGANFTFGPATGVNCDPLSSGTVNVPANTLVQGNNTITMTTTTTGDFDLTDKYVLTYQHTFFADSDQLTFQAPSNLAFTVGGFSANTIRVIDITNPLQPRELTPAVASDGAGGFRIGITAQAPGTKLYAFVDPSKVLTSTPTQDTTAAGVTIPVLKNTANKADLIIISYKDFISGLGPLVTLRQNEGLSVGIVDIQDVYDEFSFGNKDQFAIRSFLQYAQTNWQNPKPKYVLLVGDADFDPRNYVGGASLDFIPTNFVVTQFGPEAVSDDSLADFNDDGVPEYGVGRLPVNSLAQTTALVNRIVGYASNPSPASKSALLVADNYDRADYPFCQFSDDLANNTLIPNGVAAGSITKVYRAGAAPSTCGPNTTSDADAKSKIVAAANTGPTIVNWFGHGTPQVWSSGSIFTNTEAAGLTNVNNLSLYLMMTCQNANFILPGLLSLGEQLLRTTSNGNPAGAIAVWGSSGDTVPGGQVTAANTALGEILSNPNKRLGDAMIDAKNAVQDIDVRHTWILLGDPTTKIRFGNPTAVSVESFSARAAKAGIQLRWRTANESEIAGFNVYRVASGHATKLNAVLIRARYAGTTRGGSYSFRARTARHGVYRLQIVSRNGTRSWAGTLRA